MAVLRRYSDPPSVIKIWKCVIDIQEKQGTRTLNQLVAQILFKYKCDPTKAEEQIALAVRDHLLEESEDGQFSIPDYVPHDTIHDYYCFGCHNPGELIPCSSCWRVFHSRCRTDNLDGKCNECQPEDESLIRGRQISKHEVMVHACHVMKELRTTFVDIENVFSTSHHLKNQVDHLLWKKLVFPMNDAFGFSAIEKKVRSGGNLKVSDLGKDIKVLKHLIACIFGLRTQLHHNAVSAHKLTIESENLMNSCIDCFLNWRRRDDRPDWFCLPCDPPHDVIFVRQGSHFVPAKVMNDPSADQNMFEVRFFGTHTTIIVPYTDIRYNAPQQAIPRDLIDAFEEHNKYKEDAKRRTQEDQPPVEMIRSLQLPAPVGKIKRIKYESQASESDDWVRRSCRPRQSVDRLIDHCNLLTYGQFSDDSKVQRVKQEVVASRGRNNNEEIENNHSLPNVKLSSVSNGRSLPRNQAANSDETPETYPTLYPAEHPMSLIINLYRRKVQKIIEAKDLQIQQLKLDHQTNIQEIKRFHWCCVCLKKRAKKYCCIDHTYCSTRCQKLHLPSHKANCSRQLTKRCS